MTRNNATGPQVLVRFYTENFPRVPIVAAVLHRTDCRTYQHRRLAAGETIELPLGWWGRFGSEAQATAAAEEHRDTRPGSEVTYRAWCCSRRYIRQ